MDNYSKLIATLIASKAHIATKYLSPKEIIRATRVLCKGRIDLRHNTEIVLTIGRPNYREREFIKACRKDGEPFPVKKIQLKYPPNKRKKG